MALPLRLGQAHPWDLTCRVAAGDSTAETSNATTAGGLHYTVGEGIVMKAGARLGDCACL